MSKQIEYSERYTDLEFEYRHVSLPRELVAAIKSKGLLTEQEWRELGITQSRGWVHYGVHAPEPHILLFKRPVGTDPATGEVQTGLIRKAREGVERRRHQLMRV